MEYNFNTEALYQLSIILESTGLEVLDKLDIMTEAELISFIIKAINSTSFESIKLMSIVSNKTIDEIKQLKAIEYIQLVKGFVRCADWSEIMGELKTILPQKTEVEAETK